MELKEKFKIGDIVTANLESNIPSDSLIKYIKKAIVYNSEKDNNKKDVIGVHIIETTIEKYKDHKCRLYAKYFKKCTYFIW